MCSHIALSCLFGVYGGDPTRRNWEKKLGEGGKRDPESFQAQRQRRLDAQIAAKTKAAESVIKKTRASMVEVPHLTSASSPLVGMGRIRCRSSTDSPGACTYCAEWSHGPLGRQRWIRGEWDGRSRYGASCAMPAVVPPRRMPAWCGLPLCSQ